MTSPKRGEIYWVDFNPARGSEQAGRRPAVIISTDLQNRFFPVVTVAAVTTGGKAMRSELSVVLPEGDPLDRRSAIMPFQILTVANERLDEYMGCLSPEQLEEVKDRLRLVWDL